MILDICLGVLAGFLFGLIPSLHINFVSYIFLYFNLFLLFPDRFFFFISLSISQLITSYLPQTFFSVPNTENIMSLFPLHKMFLKGFSLEGIFLTFLGSFFGMLFALLFLPLLYLLFSSLIGFNFFISFAIIFTFLSFLFFEKSNKDRLIVLFIFLSSSLLGLFTLSYNYFLKEPLFVCVMGLFTLPLLIKSIFEKPKRVVQDVIDNFNFPALSAIKLSIVGSLSSLLIILVPSFSSSQAGTIVSRFKTNLSSKEYIVLFSSISISALIFSYFLAMFFYKPRLGYIAILLTEKLVLSKQDVLFFVITVILSVSLSILVISFVLKDIIRFINCRDLNKINIFILLLSITLVILISGWRAIPFLFLSTLIGFIPLQYNKSRVLLMAYIMLPTLLFYL